MASEIVFKEEQVDYLLNLFDKEVDDEGYIVDVESGERASSTEDAPIKKDELGFVGHDSVHFVEDDISSIVGYLSEQTE